MAIIDTTGWEWGEDVEPKVYDAGTRVVARIISVQVDSQKKNKSRYYARVIMEVPDDVYAKEFSDFLNFISPDMTPKEKQRVTVRWRQFERCFSVYVPASGQMNTEEWLGKEGRVELNVQTGDDGTMYNGIKEYLSNGN